jgi:hypothetical protein
MPEVPHDHSSPSPSKEVLNEEIISQLRESLPPLREAVHFTYSPKTNDEVETFKIQEQTSVTAPLLPDPQKLEKFYLDSLPHLEIP